MKEPSSSQRSSDPGPSEHTDAFTSACLYFLFILATIGGITLLLWISKLIFGLVFVEQGEARGRDTGGGPTKCGNSNMGSVVGKATNQVDNGNSYGISDCNGPAVYPQPHPLLCLRQCVIVPIEVLLNTISWHTTHTAHDIDCIRTCYIGTI
ncbi:hypothetical protein EX30DRAFT_390328 [Ascodesmis nigricans]|uniref:Uncharacterized protein n=1 Tax=Ascodesmis nigricans TaxID=341454 RepID=A0A4S2MY15_9PEZI|nr:hypothetical protein EX30DRAFT_390328 [Ascodesmis nigricans]